MSAPTKIDGVSTADQLIPQLLSLAITADALITALAAKKGEGKAIAELKFKIAAITDASYQ